MTSRKQKTIRINSVSADIATVPRPSKITHHHECKPKQKQTKVGVMSEKPNNTGKTSKRNHRKEEKVHLKNILSSQKYSRSRQKNGFEKIPFKAGFVFWKCDNCQDSVSINFDYHPESEKT